MQTSRPRYVKDLLTLAPSSPNRCMTCASPHLPLTSANTHWCQICTVPGPMWKNLRCLKCSSVCASYFGRTDMATALKYTARECMSTQLDRGAVLCGPSGAVAFPHQLLGRRQKVRKARRNTKQHRKLKNSRTSENAENGLY